MVRIIDKLKGNSLFLKLTLIILISSISASVITAFAIMNISKKLFINNFSITNTKILKQLQANSSDLNDKVINFINTINDSWAFRRYLSEYDYTSIELSNIIYNFKQDLKIKESSLDTKNIDFFILGNNNSTYIGSSALLTTPVEDIKANIITENALKNPDKLIYQYSNSGFTSLTKDKNCIIATKVLQDRNTKKQFGILYVLITESVFNNLYSNFTTDGNDIVILSSTGTIISSSKQNLIGCDDKDLLGVVKKTNNENLKYTNLYKNKKNYTILKEYMPIYDFYFVNVIDTNKALKDMYNLNEIIFICSTIIVISVSILFIVTKKATNPLRILVREMSKITEGNLNNHINLQGSLEIQKLSNSFNYMLDGLNDHIDKLLKAEKNQRKAELWALQMQINPHFIYNTLASIKWLVLKGDKEKSSETIDSFISLLQNTISETSETITIAQEIENMQNYVFINHTRYGDNIKVNFHVLPNCNDYRIPKLILQPFIENAFFHAFTDNTEGRIHVFISEKNNKLFCEIVDNGKGMDESIVSNLYSSPSYNHRHFAGIGVKNVDDRIKLLYGNEYGVTIDSKVGLGTTINIYLPLITT